MSQGKLTGVPNNRQLADHSISDRDLSEFLLRACHDLREPSRAIRLHAELIRKRAQSPGTAGDEQRLDFIVDGAGRIDILLDGLTNYSIALQTERTSFRRARMDVILRTALAKLAGELRDRGAEVTYGELPSVYGSPDRLVQIFENLIRNALRHGGHSSPRIDISALQHVDEWQFAIRDNGRGIEADYLERIFKPFERLRTADRKGAGMGLAICRAIVERHGGRLWAESIAGTGSTFCFTLPVADS